MLPGLVYSYTSTQREYTTNQQFGDSTFIYLLLVLFMYFWGRDNRISCLSRMHFLIKNTTKSVILSFVPLMEKLNFQQPLLQSWMLHDPSEIILILYADLLQKKYIIVMNVKRWQNMPPPQVCFDEKRVLKNLKFEICYKFYQLKICWIKNTNFWTEI